MFFLDFAILLHFCYPFTWYLFNFRLKEWRTSRISRKWAPLLVCCCCHWQEEGHLECTKALQYLPCPMATWCTTDHRVARVQRERPLGRDRLGHRQDSPQAGWSTGTLHPHRGDPACLPSWDRTGPRQKEPSILHPLLRLLASQMGPGTSLWVLISFLW